MDSLSFKTPTKKESSNIIRINLPNGKLWEGKNYDDTYISKFIDSLGEAFNTIQNQIENLVYEFNIETTTELLPDWEKSVGLPDNCINELRTLEQRRQDVIDKFNKIPIVTIDQFKQFFEKILETEIMLKTGVEVERLPAELPLQLSSTNSNFKLYLTYENAVLRERLPLALPFQLGVVQEGLITCLAEQILPGNVILIITED